MGSRSSSLQRSRSSPRVKRPTSLLRSRAPSYGRPLNSSGSPIATRHLSRAYATNTLRRTSWRCAQANGTSRCSAGCGSGWPIRSCPGCYSHMPEAPRRVSCSYAPCALWGYLDLITHTCSQPRKLGRCCRASDLDSISTYAKPCVISGRICRDVLYRVANLNPLFFFNFVEPMRCSISSLTIPIRSLPFMTSKWVNWARQLFCSVRSLTHWRV